MWVSEVGGVCVWVHLSTADWPEGAAPRGLEPRLSEAERRTLNYMQGMQHLPQDSDFVHAFGGEVNKPNLFRYQQSISCSCSPKLTIMQQVCCQSDFPSVDQS